MKTVAERVYETIQTIVPPLQARFGALHDNGQEGTVETLAQVIALYLLADTAAAQLPPVLQQTVTEQRTLLRASTDKLVATLARRAP